MPAARTTAASDRTLTRHLMALLERHYIARPDRPGGIFAAEIEAPGGGRRADLIWQGVTATSGTELHGHEVKVSRPDLQRELDDPTKADAWQRYCDRWWLVVADPRLIDGLTLPNTWGVLAPPSGRRTRSMTVLIDAPALHPREKGPAICTLATRLHWRNVDLTARADSLQRTVDRLREDLDSLRTQTPDLALPQTGPEPVVRAIVEQLGVYANTLGDHLHRVNVEDVVAALRDIGAIRHQCLIAERHHDFTLSSIRRLHEDLGELITATTARSADHR
jgi:hypothetical protein